MNLFQYNVTSDLFTIQTGDLIGWTNEAAVGIITSDRVAGYIMKTRSMTMNGINPIYPSVGSLYQFDSTSLNVTASVAVEIDHSKKTGAIFFKT